MKLKLQHNKDTGTYRLVDAETGELVENLVSLQFGYGPLPIFEIRMFLDTKFLEIIEDDFETPVGILKSEEK